MSDVVHPPEPLQLRITEIFRSLQGESDSVGWPTVFIRLTGCPLRCVYCDTAYAFTGGQRRAIDDIIREVRALNTKEICVTGGEPLAQPACVRLLTHLCDENFAVSLETSGAIDITDVDPRVRIVMDLKTPSSGELSKNLYTNLDHLKTTDEVKFVVGNSEDFQWAHEQILKYQLDQRVNVLISPVFDEITPVMLAGWILATGLRIRMQMQLH
ncbi:MAG: 7-carboxy-7-deazaguanine synthase QueE, partial [Halothiobacillus sp.]